MQDSQKTKAQLIEELAECRDRLAALTDESAADAAAAADATRPERSQLQTSIQFYRRFRPSRSQRTRPVRGRHWL